MGMTEVQAECISPVVSRTAPLEAKIGRPPEGIVLIAGIIQIAEVEVLEEGVMLGIGVQEGEGMEEEEREEIEASGQMSPVTWKEAGVAANQILLHHLQEVIKIGKMPEVIEGSLGHPGAMRLELFQRISLEVIGVLTEAEGEEEGET